MFHMLVNSSTSFSAGDIIFICTMITTIAAAAAVISKSVKKFVNNITKESIDDAIKSARVEFGGEMSKSHKSMTESLESLKVEVEAYISKNNEDTELMKENLLFVTRDRINQAHDYYLSKGFIGSHTLSILEDLYKSYQRLGGNSFIGREMEDIRNLDLVSAETLKKKRGDIDD